MLFSNQLLLYHIGPSTQSSKVVQIMPIAHNSKIGPAYSTIMLFLMLIKPKKTRKSVQVLPTLVMAVLLT